MVIYVLKTVIFRCIYEHPRLVYPLGDCTFKVVFFHAKFDDLSLTFPNLRGKLNFWVCILGQYYEVLCISLSEPALSI